MEIGDFLGSLTVLLALIVATLVFITVINGLFGRNRNRVTLGIQVLALFSLLWLAKDISIHWAGLDAYATDIAGAIATLWWLSTAFLINACMRKFLWEGVFWQDGGSTVPKLLTGVVAAFVYLIAIMVVMHFVYDKPITAVAATSGAFAFVFGYSAKETLGDIFAGLSLSLSRSLRRGDWVEIDGSYGQVRDMNWRAVTLFSTSLDSHIVLPNANVAQAKIINYSQPEYFWRGATQFYVEQSAPPGVVRAAILKKLATAQCIRQTPPPDVHVLEFHTWGTQFQVRWRFEGEEVKWAANDEVMSAIWSALREEDISFSYNRGLGFPKRDSPEAFFSGREIMDADALAGVLKRTPPFDVLSDAALRKACESAKVIDAEPPTRIIQQGETASSIFLIVEGEARVLLDIDGREMPVGEVRAGGVAGLSPRDGNLEQSVAVQASDYLIAYEIPLSAIVIDPENEQAFADGLRTAYERDMETYRAGHAEALRLAQEAEIGNNKKRIIAGLADKIKGFFGGGPWRPGQRKRTRDLMQGFMAASALVAIADGNADEAEKAEAINVLDTLDLLSHLDRSKSLALLDEYVAVLEADPNDPRPWDAVGKLAGDDEVAPLVVGVCHAISAADGTVDMVEEERIAEIATKLGVDG